jgi:hypothetical protein
VFSSAPPVTVDPQPATRELIVGLPVAKLVWRGERGNMALLP